VKPRDQKKKKTGWRGVQQIIAEFSGAYLIVLLEKNTTSSLGGRFSDDRKGVPSSIQVRAVQFDRISFFVCVFMAVMACLLSRPWRWSSPFQNVNRLSDHHRGPADNVEPRLGHLDWQ